MKKSVDHKDRKVERVGRLIHSNGSVPHIRGRCELEVSDLIRALGSAPERPKEKREWLKLTMFLGMYSAFLAAGALAWLLSWLLS